jgi:hypothetical protein
MKAKEIAEKLLIKKAKIRQGDKEREIVLKDRMHIFEGMKVAFNIKDDDEISEGKFKEMMDAFLESKSHELPNLSKKSEEVGEDIATGALVTKRKGGNK